MTVSLLRFLTAPLARCIGCLLTGVAVTMTAQAADAPSPEPARVIVQFKSESTIGRMRPLAVGGDPATPRAQALAQRTGIALRAGASVSARSQVVHADGMGSAELAARLAAQPDVEYAVIDRRRRAFAIPNDPLYLTGGANGPAVGQWYLRPPTASAPSAINAESAWDTTLGSSNVVVAVLDTGIRFDHADLVPAAFGGNVLAGYDFISDPTTANDGNGRDADPTDPGDWITAAENAEAGGPFANCGVSNSSWHGTEVAALIAAATDNGFGMAGVGRRTRLLPVRVLGKCGGFDSDIIAGMRWAAGLSVPGVPANLAPAQVINLSLGGSGSCSALYANAIAEVNATGAIVVAAAGNSAGHAVSEPANCNGAIAVAGLRHVGTKVGFSDLGPEIALGAPAGNCVDISPGAACRYPILTAINAGTTTPAPGSSIFSDSFRITVGTSFSAPLVAGTAALMLSVRPTATISEIKTWLQQSARPFPTTGGDNGDGSIVPQCTAPRTDGSGRPIDQLQCYCTTATCGAGMLDAAAAVRSALIGRVISSNRDFNRDGHSDIIWQNSSGERAIWLMNGSTLVSGAVFASVEPAWQIAATADFNGDGRPDIVWQHLQTGERVIWYMDGTNRIGSERFALIEPAWQIVGAADFNGDGKNDILWQHSSGSRAIWLMSGAIRIGALNLGHVAPEWSIAGTGDFNGDGHTDIVWQHSNGERVFWFMNGTSFVSGLRFAVLDSNWQIAGVGDFNQDGKPDLLWQHVNGNRAIWFMDGSNVLAALGLGNVSSAWSIVR